MRAVDGLKVYRQPRAFTVWMQSRLRDSKAGRDSDPGDLVSILAPATDEGDSNKIGYGAVNGFQDTEDDSVADFDVLLIVNVSSGSEESTDGEHNPGRDDDSDDDVGNVDEVTTGVEGGGTNWEDGGNDRDSSCGSDGAHGGEDEDANLTRMKTLKRNLTKRRTMSMQFWFHSTRDRGTGGRR